MQKLPNFEANKRQILWYLPTERVDRAIVKYDKHKI